MPHISFHDSWNTEKEIEFLTRLGSHTERQRDREKLLSNYIKLARLRYNWCPNMNVQKIISAASLMLSVSKDTLIEKTTNPIDNIYKNFFM